MHKTGIIFIIGFVLFSQNAIAQRLDFNSAILPSHRSVAVNDTFSHFAVIINSSSTDTFTNCRLRATGNIAGDDEALRRASFTYQTVDASNSLTGTPNTPVDIPPGGTQYFVFSMDAGAIISNINAFVGQTIYILCDNASGQEFTYLNTSSLFYSDIKAPMDALAIASTPSNDGVMRISNAGATGAFSLAATNLGSAGANENVIVTPTLEVQTEPFAFNRELVTSNAFSKLAELSICETNPSDGTCLAPAAASVTASLGTGVSTFSVFVTPDAELGAALLPQWLRITVNFVPETAASDEIAGRTSVALQAPGSLTGSADTFAGLSPGLYTFRSRPHIFTSAAGNKDGEFIVFDPPTPAASDKLGRTANADNPLMHSGWGLGILFARLFDGGNVALPVKLDDTSNIANLHADIRNPNDPDKPPNGTAVTPPAPRTHNGMGYTMVRDPQDWPGDELVLLQKAANDTTMKNFTNNLGIALNNNATLSVPVRNPATGAVEGTLNLGPNDTTSQLDILGCMMRIVQQPPDFQAFFIYFVVTFADIAANSCASPGEFYMVINESILAERAYEPTQSGSSYASVTLFGMPETPTEGQGIVFASEFRTLGGL